MVDYSPPNRWIWQHPDWPHFYWQDGMVSPHLRDLHTKLGVLLGKVGTVSKHLSAATALDTLLQNIITSSAIEGEQLNAASVRSSLAQRLGVMAEDGAFHYPTSARTEGLAELMMSAVQEWDTPLSMTRLFQPQKGDGGIKK